MPYSSGSTYYSIRLPRTVALLIPFFISVDIFIRARICIIPPNCCCRTAVLQTPAWARAGCLEHDVFMEREAVWSSSCSQFFDRKRMHTKRTIRQLMRNAQRMSSLFFCLPSIFFFFFFVFVSAFILSMHILLSCFTIRRLGANSNECFGILLVLLGCWCFW